MNQKHDIRQQQSTLEHKRTTDFFNVRMENVSLGSYNGLSGTLVEIIVRLSSGMHRIEIGLQCSLFYCIRLERSSTLACEWRKQALAGDTYPSKLFLELENQILLLCFDQATVENTAECFRHPRAAGQTFSLRKSKFSHLISSSYVKPEELLRATNVAESFYGTLC